jgi:hypothetical protein
MRLKMKKLLATVCVLGSTLALTACDTTGSGYVDTQPPYATERTVGAAPAAYAPAEAPKSAEPVFEKRVTK